MSNREILTCAHVIVAVLGEDWLKGLGVVRVCFPFIEGPEGSLCMDGSVDRSRWFAPGLPLPGQPTDIAVVNLPHDAPPSVKRAMLRKHQENTSVKIYGFRGKELSNGTHSHEEGEYIEGKIHGSLPGGRAEFVGTDQAGVPIERGFSGTGVYEQEGNAIVGMIVEADRDKFTKIAQFIDVPSLEQAVGRLLEIDDRPDPFAEHSPQTRAIREAAASDCASIKFLGGEGRMDRGYYRKLTIRGRRPDDQTEIAKAVEYLISETLWDRVGRLPSGSSFKRRTEESDHGESWPIVSLDDRIKEKCAVEVKGQLRALLLTDEPGGGKSTTARNVAWRVAMRESPFEDERRLPVYIRLRDWEKVALSRNSGRS